MGVLLLVTGGSMSLPVICSLYYGGDDLFALSITAFMTILIGLPLFLRYRHNHELGIRDAIVIAPLGWMIVSALSACRL
jgi:trk system potassium uptake protein TrkH